MGLLEKLKSFFESGNDSGRASDPGRADVTVEHEPSAESEHAVKGTGDEGAAVTSETNGADESDDESGTDESTEPDAETPDAEPESPSVQEIRGIGPTYSGRLTDAGIGTVADLAAADPETVADAAEVSTTRADDWIERARDR